MTFKRLRAQGIRSFAFFLVFCLALAMPLHGMDIIREGTAPSFEVIDRSSGLSNLSVSSIIQDREGFLWFGTQGGLNKYDGRTFKHYTHDPFEESGLLHNLIQTLYYDAENHDLWIGTYQGLSQLDIEHETFTHYTVESKGLSNPVVVAIEKDSGGNIWAGTLDGLNVINPQTGTLKSYPVPGKVVRDLLEDTNGKLWIGSYEGLLYFDAEKDQVQNSGYVLPTPSVMVVNEFDPGILSLGLWDGGLVKIDLATQEIETKLFEDNRVYSYIRTDDKTEWIGTWGGGLFAVLPTGEIYGYKNRPQQDQLPHDIVYSMIQDDTGIMWIGTNGGGIAKVNPLKRNYVTYKHIPDDPTSLSNGKVNGIARDKAGDLWVAVYNEGLNRISPEGTIIKYPANPNQAGALANPNVVVISEDHQGDLLFAASNIIYTFDRVADQFKPIITMASDVIVYAIEKGDDQALWIGTYRNGIFKAEPQIKDGKVVDYTLKEAPLGPLADNLVYDVLRDSQGRLWIATNNGLNLKSSKSDELIVFKRVSGDRKQLASNTVRVVFEDQKGRIWVGLVGGGIAYYNENGTFTTFVESDGMPSNTVLGILEGDDGRIWASTQNGLAVIEPEAASIFVLTPEEGIGGYEFNSGHFKDDQDVMYFGGIHGITTIPGNISSGITAPPRLYITGVQVNQEHIRVETSHFNNQNLEFKADERFISISFVALDYDAPDKTSYLYRLEGFDDRWINLENNNTVNFSKLNPGKYTFEVYAQTTRGVQSEVQRMSFVIAAPWYQTTWAYFLYAMILMGIIYSLIQVRLSYVLAERNQKLAEVNHQLEEANEKLESLATIDALTSLYNRRYLSVRLEEELRMAIRSHLPISMLMLDLDNFKQINDAFGHLLGDQYLIKVGACIKDALARATDFGVRYGGDEFMIVLFDTDEVGAMQVAQAIHKAIEAIILEVDDQVLDIQTTTSMGVVTIVPEPGIDLMHVTKLADEALYEAKRHGKNMITVYKS